MLPVYRWGGRGIDRQGRIALFGPLPRRRDLPFLSVQPLRAHSLFVDTTHTVALPHFCSVSFFHQKLVIVSQRLNRLLLSSGFFTQLMLIQR